MSEQKRIDSLVAALEMMSFNLEQGDVYIEKIDALHVLKEVNGEAHEIFWELHENGGITKEHRQMFADLVQIKDTIFSL